MDIRVCDLPAEEADPRSGDADLLTGWPRSAGGTRPCEPGKTRNEAEPRGDKGAEEAEARDRQAREDQQVRRRERGLHLRDFLYDLLDVIVPGARGRRRERRRMS